MGAGEPYPTSGPGGAPGSTPGTGPPSARVADGVGETSVSGCSLMRNARPHATSRSPLEIAGLDELDLAARARHRRRHRQRGQGHGPQELDGEPGDVHGLVGRERLDGAGEQRGHRAAVQRVGSPRPPRELGRHHGSPSGWKRASSPAADVRGEVTRRAARAGRAPTPAVGR